MKKIRFLSLALALLMLCGLVPMFASCAPKKDGIVKLSAKRVEVDLTGYTLVYGDSQRGEEYTAIFRDRMNYLAEMLSGATGESFSPYTMTRAKTNAADKEILVGLTKRRESQELLSKIKGDGFAIEVTENKVVLVGTSNLFTLMAVNYFIDTYLKGVETPNKVLTLNKTATANEVGTVTLATNTEANYTYVYKDGMGTYPPGFAGTDHKTLSTSTYKEYSQVAIDEVIANLGVITGLREKYFPIKTDKEAYEREVLVGPVGNEESVALLQTVAENEFIIAVEGEDVIVNAWSEEVLASAVACYQELLIEATEKKSDGSVAVVLPKALRYTAFSDKNWVLDFPRPEAEGLSLYNTMDAGDGALQFLYMGEGATAEAQKAYCDKLKGEGYSVYMDTAIEGSIYTTLVNKEENIMLYVAYNAYAHKEEYDTEYNWTRSKTATKDFGWYEYDPAIRVVSAPLDKACLPDQHLLTPQAYTKVTDFAISTMPLYHGAVGLIYVLTLEDGSFIVFDGGNISENGTEYDALWNVMEMRYTEVYGEAPTPQKPIRIAAWIMTHPHVDHFVAFERMLKKYGSTHKLRIDYMIANTPAEHSAYPVRYEGSHMNNSRLEGLQKLVDGGFKYIKARSGYRFHLANVEIEVLACWEDLNPWVINDGNETCTVLRFEVSNQDAPTAEPVTQIWTGDAQRWLSRYLCATYGSYLEADMVSVGHHGNIGCEIDFYDTVKPTTIWWPHNVGAVKSYLYPNNVGRGWQYEVDQYFANKIPEVKYIFASGGADYGETMDGPYTTLKFGVNGPDYDNIYDLKTKEKINYSNYLGDGVGVSACMKK